LITDSRVTMELKPRQLAGKIAADWQWEQRDEWGLGCTAVYKVGRHAGRRCMSKPGKGTDHVGLGPCVAHGGAKQEGRARAAWLMAHAYAAEYDVSPWEALLLVIRITAGKLRYIESVLATAENDDELTGAASGTPLGVEVGGANDGGVIVGRNLSWWVEQSQLERQTLAKVSKAAIDAGVAQLLIEKELRGGEELAGRFVRALEDMERAGMSDEMLDIARKSLRAELEKSLAPVGNPVIEAGSS
jgi:hypothetical protein